VGRNHCGLTANLADWSTLRVGAAGQTRTVPQNRDVLIVGASVAGPTLAYWLRRYGFNPTVVERTPSLRAGLGGHAVDLFGPAVDVAEKMGILPQVMDARTKTEVLSFLRPGKPAIDVNMAQLVAGVSDRHVEIMRGELASILYEATRADIEYVFGDTVRTLEETPDAVEVTFERTAPRRFGLVVGADGLHSIVRRLVFGDERQFLHYIGGYLAVFTAPNYLKLDGRMAIYTTPGRVAGVYPVRQTGEARAGFLFRREQQFVYDHRDKDQQKALLREVYADQGWEVPRLLAELDTAADLYFDSISQVIMNRWSRGRVTLVGDAGYSPGPAVGGGTSIATVGAYVLAGELSRAGGDPTAALPRYDTKMNDFVLRARKLGTTTMRTLIPATPAQVQLLIQTMRVVPRLPAFLQRRLGALQGAGARALDSIALEDYEV
jgi:2-polyprenyl-6-methoxyphenol hydroxylase-like FAD-dependent oxidoreductase